MNPQLIQIKALIEQGLSLEQAADILNIAPEQCKMFLTDKLQGFEAKSVDELIETYKPQIIRELYNIGMDIELNPSARVGALKTLLELGTASTSELEVERVKKQYEKMQKSMEKYSNSPKNVNSKPEIKSEENIPAVFTLETITL